MKTIVLILAALALLTAVPAHAVDTPLVDVPNVAGAWNRGKEDAYRIIQCCDTLTLIAEAREHGVKAKGKQTKAERTCEDALALKCIKASINAGGRL